MLCSDLSKYNESSNKNLKKKEPLTINNLERTYLNFFIQKLDVKLDTLVLTT